MGHQILGLVGLLTATTENVAGHGRQRWQRWKPQHDIFLEADYAQTTYLQPCLQRGYSTYVGPFPAGTKMGFYLITNGKKHVAAFDLMFGVVWLV